MSTVEQCHGWNHDHPAWMFFQGHSVEKVPTDLPDPSVGVPKRDVELEFVITKVDDLEMVSKLRWRSWGWKFIRGVGGMKGLPVVFLTMCFLRGSRLVKCCNLCRLRCLEEFGDSSWTDFLQESREDIWFEMCGHMMYTSSQPKMHCAIGSSTSFQQQTL